MTKHGLQMAMALDSGRDIVSRRDSPAGTGRDTTLKGCPCPGVPSPDPAARWRDRRTRRAAWAAYIAACEAWDARGLPKDAPGAPQPPGGIASYSLDACQPRQHQRDRWRR
jgi:hypothetical protein